MSRLNTEVNVRGVGGQVGGAAESAPVGLGGLPSCTSLEQIKVVSVKEKSTGR